MTNIQNSLIKPSFYKIFLFSRYYQCKISGSAVKAEPDIVSNGLEKKPYSMIEYEFLDNLPVKIPEHNNIQTIWDRR
jgi:hypothetical protein